MKNRSLLLLAAAVTVAHVLTAGGYGIFRDELYYLACARHLDWGYVDHPPLVALGAWVVSHVLGTSVHAIRLLPALAAGVHVLLAGAIAGELGGGRFARLFTGLVVALTPIYLSLLSIYSMNAFDLVAWSGLILVAMRILRTGNQRLWLLFGGLAGLGLMNKLSVLFLGLGVAAGLVLAGRWRECLGRHLWLGAGLALLVFAPHVVWQIVNGWPTAEFIHRATAFKNVAFSPLEFMARQIRMLNPVAFPLWLCGLGALLFARSLRPYRAIGWMYLAVLALLITQSSKPYYLAAVYPPLCAAGAVTLERFTSRSGRAWLRAIAVFAIAISGAGLAPLARPLLSEDRYVAYARALGVEPGTDERKNLGRLPQFFADMHGWRDLAEAVAAVYRELPREDRTRACVFGQNYGEAGAIDVFGPELGLPPAVSGHNSYWLWGPGDCTGDVLIVIGGREEDLVAGFTDVVAAGRFDCVDCMPYEDDQVLWVAKGLRRPIEEVWPEIKHFD